ncbi:dynobactin maturation radical SAM/SPASM protein DynA, partial [Xenorhabdus bovienii]|uniref:dynobactin maturation radical SAM/SPASM protein DynA n=1 Tax=Xenorhabdus bovienii TaxID=40576 RepID=UPI0023B32EBF
MQLVNITKPTHRCNLACKYCYNEDIRHPVMTLETLEKTIKDTFDYANDKKVFTYVHFIWHGGEPMLPGINFYENVVDFQEKYSNGIKYLNALQTNGTLITQRWCDFIKKNKFFMSISIDGPKDLNDKNRVTHKDTGSFNKIIEGINKLRKNDINVGCALVMSKTNMNHTDEIYDFMFENKLPFNVIPLNKSGNAVDNYQDLGLGPDEYYLPWSKLYDKWFYAEPENYIFVSDFVRKTQAILAGRAADCIGMAQCGNTSFSVDPVGDLYPCASLSAQPGMKYGNLQNNSILELMNST